MNKLKFFKKTLAMGLAAMSLVPAVGATKSDDEEGLSQPPKKIVKTMKNDDEKELLCGVVSAESSHKVETESMRMFEMLRYALLFYSQKEAREYVRRAPKENCFMEALNYMFNFFDEKEKFDSARIKRSLNTLSRLKYENDTLVDQMEELISSDELELKCRRYFINKDVAKKLSTSGKNGTFIFFTSSYFNCFLNDFKTVSLGHKNYELTLVENSWYEKRKYPCKTLGENCWCEKTEYICKTLAVKREDGKWIYCNEMDFKNGNFEKNNFGIGEISEKDAMGNAFNVEAGDRLGYSIK